MAKKTSKPTAKIEMKYIEVVAEFFPAIHSLGSLSIKNVEIVMAIAKAKKLAKDIVEEFNDARKQLAEADCEKDKENKPIIEDDKYKYPSEEVQNSTNRSIMELEQQLVTLQVRTFKIGLLRNVEGLNGNTVEALREMIIE